MFDKVELLSNSTIQHGPYNDRIYLMKVGRDENVSLLIEKMFDLAIVNEYSKIFVSVPESLSQIFLDRTFKLEATIPGLYHGEEDGCFLSLYLNAKRGFLPKKERGNIDSVIETVHETSETKSFDLPEGYELMRLDESAISELAGIYKEVFQFYPFPIHDESYLLETMAADVVYFGIRYKGKLVAVSSADIDKKNNYAEMTDFATLKGNRGKNLSYFLLQKMLKEMQGLSVKTVYTIARAKSIGMNKTFARHGFEFTGTLLNNTRIGDSIESMNVWYKRLG